MSNKQTLFLSLATALSLSGNVADAGEISTNTAQMQAMDKITGRVSVINVPVNSEVKFGSFSIVVRDCKTRSPEETPENFAFVDVVDVLNEDEKVNIFKGWMLSSSQALNAVEHPVYDVWLLKCINTDISQAKILTSDELTARDALPKQKPESYRTAKNKDGTDFIDENLSGQPIDLLPADIRAAGEEDVAQGEVLPINPVQTIEKIENEADFISSEDETLSLSEAIAAEKARLTQEQNLENNLKPQSVSEEKNDEDIVEFDVEKIDVSKENFDQVPDLSGTEDSPMIEVPQQIHVSDTVWQEENNNVVPEISVQEEPVSTEAEAEFVSAPTEDLQTEPQLPEKDITNNTDNIIEPVSIKNIDIRKTFPLQPEIIINENIAQDKEIKAEMPKEEPDNITETPTVESLPQTEPKTETSTEPQEEKTEPEEEDNSNEQIIEIDADILSSLEEELEQTKANN